MEKGRTQSQHFWSNFDSSFPPEDSQNRKNKQQHGKTSTIELSKYLKMKSLSSLTFPGKIRLLFAIFAIFLPGNRAGSQVKGVESKFDKYYFIHTILGQIFVKKFWFKYFPVLRLQITKDISEKSQLGFSNLSDFLGTNPTFFKNFQKVKLPDV